MIPGGGNSFSDLLRALDALAPGDERTRTALARMLGFDTPVTLPPPSTSSKEPPRASPSTSSSVSASGNVGPKSRPKLPRLKRVSYEPAEKSAAWKAVAPLPLAKAELLATRLAHEPLLEPRRSRNLLTAALATDGDNGAIDIPRLVDLLACGQSIPSIPRLPWPSLFRGVQILIDLGEGMEPFIRDQEDVLGKVHHIVGEGRTRELQFRYCPLRGAGPGPIWTWGPYEPPDPGTPVFALTDLGLGGPAFLLDRATEDEWLSFEARLRTRSCPLIALVPYPADRWPRSLAQAMTILTWDRTTKARAVQRTLAWRRRRSQ